MYPQNFSYYETTRVYQRTDAKTEIEQQLVVIEYPRIMFNVTYITGQL